jgi:choline-sulfatase
MLQIELSSQEKAQTQLMKLPLYLLSLFLSISTFVHGERPNILMIAVDDLRPQLSSYGQSQIQSPNIDKLAASGTRFNRAYCMVPTCGASRASLMSGVRPSASRFVGYTARIDEDAPEITPLHLHLKNNGYNTASLGKILHYPADMEHGWTQSPWRPKRDFKGSSEPIVGWSPPTDLDALTEQSRNHRLPFASYDVPDDTLGDGQVAAEAIKQLKTLSQQEAPFFLAVGFFKPHLPFNAPKTYWDIYDDTPIDVPDNYSIPEDAPKAAIHNFGELRNYAGVPNKGPVSDQMAKTLIRGYYASVSFTDAQVGRVLEELEQSGLSENTIVILWGDHGWNLGEHSLWAKHCTFENSMRVPLIIRTPQSESAPQGQTTNTLTEFIDIYPTLCELAGIDAPKHLDGQSLAPVLKDPDSTGKGYAIGRFSNGDTIRSNRWRYTEYTTKEDRGDGRIVSRMLYDHDKDPEENRNLANIPEYKPTIEKLSRQLNQLKGR